MRSFIGRNKNSPQLVTGGFVLGDPLKRNNLRGSGGPAWAERLPFPSALRFLRLAALRLVRPYCDKQKPEKRKRHREDERLVQHYCLKRSRHPDGAVSLHTG